MIGRGVIIENSDCFSGATQLGLTEKIKSIFTGQPAMNNRNYPSGTGASSSEPASCFFSLTIVNVEPMGSPQFFRNPNVDSLAACSKDRMAIC